MTHEETVPMPDSPEPTLTMTGDIDVASEHTWRRESEEFLAANPDVRNVAVDMSRVDFIDSRGMAVLVSLHTAALARGGKLTLFAVPRRIVKAVSVAGLDQVFSITPG